MRAHITGHYSIRKGIASITKFLMFTMERIPAMKHLMWGTKLRENLRNATLFLPIFYKVEPIQVLFRLQSNISIFIYIMVTAKYHSYVSQYLPFHTQGNLIILWHLNTGSICFLSHVLSFVHLYDLTLVINFDKCKGKRQIQEMRRGSSPRQIISGVCGSGKEQRVVKG